MFKGVVKQIKRFPDKIPQQNPTLRKNPLPEAQEDSGSHGQRVVHRSSAGINTLAQMLPKMCKEAGTRAVYTNHNLRATAIQKLSDAGPEAREIMRWGTGKMLLELCNITVESRWRCVILIRPNDSFALKK